MGETLITKTTVTINVYKTGNKVIKTTLNVKDFLKILSIQQWIKNILPAGNEIFEGLLLLPPLWFIVLSKHNIMWHTFYLNVVNFDVHIVQTPSYKHWNET